LALRRWAGFLLGVNMVDEKVLADLDQAKNKIGDVKELLNRLYYHPEFGKVFDRPVISILLSACDYLVVNLDHLKTRYAQR